MFVFILCLQITNNPLLSTFNALMFLLFIQDFIICRNLSTTLIEVNEKYLCHYIWHDTGTKSRRRHTTRNIIRSRRQVLSLVKKTARPTARRTFQFLFIMQLNINSQTSCIDITVASINIRLQYINSKILVYSVHTMTTLELYISPILFQVV